MEWASSEMHMAELGDKHLHNRLVSLLDTVGIPTANRISAAKS